MTILPYFLLAGSLLVLLLAVWLPVRAHYSQAIAGCLLAASVLVSCWLGAIDAVAVWPLVMLLGVALVAAKADAKGVRYVALAGTLVLAFLLATHKFPGFQAQIWLDSVQFSAAARPFTLTANLDKPWVGTILLLAYSPLARGKLPLLQTGFLVVGSAMLIILAGVGIGVPIEPKWNGAVAVFLLHNLFLTCIAEEAFFRLLLQTPLQTALQRVPGSGIITITLVSLLFAAVHYHAGNPWFVPALITLGGMVYASVFHITRSLHAAILTHFFTNALHILFLRYPLS